MKTKKTKKRNLKMDTKSKILSKFTSGRTKGIKKRKKTLLLEYKLMNKTNKFLDRRIGEKNRAMTEEDRVMARFVAQRVKAYNKKQMFNLGDGDETLTHHGLNLQDIEKFDNPQSESEDENDNGKLEAEFVKKAHFGGGLFTKVSPNENDHRSVVDQLIAESKIKKAERQQTKEENIYLTEKLDKDLKELFPIFSQSQKDDPENSSNSKLVKESYDVLVRELKFAPIGKPSNKLKSEDQIALQEKQKLERLEKERLERMKRTHDLEDTNENEPSCKKYQSADDLDDGFALDTFDDIDEESEEGSLIDNDDDNESDSDQNDCKDDECSISDDGNESINENQNMKSHCSASSNQNILRLETSKNVTVPSNLFSLQQILNEKTVDEKIDIIKRLIKEQRLHNGVSNKEPLLNFFSVLLEYIDSVFISSEHKDCWILTSKLSPILYDLVQIGGDLAAESMLKVIKKKQDIFCKHIKQGATTDMLVFLKLVPLLFPTSDYYHPVATPSTAFLCHILSQNSCRTLECISKGLFLATLMLEYTSLSGRYCPEVINFLQRVLYAAVPGFEDIFPPIHTKNKILVLSNDNDEGTISEKNTRLPFSFVSSDVPVNNKSKILIIYVCFKLLSAYCNLYSKFSATFSILSSVLVLLDKLPIDKYPLYVQAELTKLRNEINLIKTCPLHYLVAERKRPKALRLYEPNIRPIIDGQSFRTVSHAKLEKEKLMHQYKREMKGALREIRKDKNFLARVKVSEQAKRDAERKEKVKRIFSWGQNQQSEFKKMERKNRFKR